MLSARVYQENLKQKYDKRWMERDGKPWYMRIRRKGWKIWNVVRTETCHM